MEDVIGLRIMPLRMGMLGFYLEKLVVLLFSFLLYYYCEILHTYIANFNYVSTTVCKTE